MSRSNRSDRAKKEEGEHVNVICYTRPPQHYSMHAGSDDCEEQQRRPEASDDEDSKMIPRLAGESSSSDLESSGG